MSSVGFAARHWPAVSLLILAAAHGITGVAVRQDFEPSGEVSTVPPEVPDAITLRALKPPRRRGQSLAIPRPQPIGADDAIAAALAESVKIANAFAAGFTVAGALPPQWKRSYTADWSLGGRWTAVGAQNYQTLSGTRRLAMTISGAPVCELDVRASHLSILHGLLGLPLPADDPYTVDGIDRAVVKAWIVGTLGKGSPVLRWASDTSPAIKATSARLVGAAIVERFPFMAEPGRAVESMTLGPPRAILIHRLMNLEATALTLAMGQLRAAGILALPVHDALLVPAGAAAIARRAMEDGYRKVAGITPYITAQRAPVA